jgi:hypothetical protein
MLSHFFYKFYVLIQCKDLIGIDLLAIKYLKMILNKIMINF